MIKKVLLNRTLIYLIVLVVMIVPTFWRMLRPGIFSMQDYHTFRLYEFNKCIADGQIPCRWTPDATFEYGQPTFDFYGQGTYWYGQLFRLMGLGVIDTIKALFISSLVLSALAMFLLARQIWKNDLSAFVCAIVYSYAPYRAVDVWVRGALPEALGFVFLPLIIYFLNQFLETRRVRSLFLFGLTTALLAATHNLSIFMSIFLLVPWVIFQLIRLRLYKDWKIWTGLVLMGVLVAGLASFYLLPVIFESSLVSIEKTYIGFYNFNNHFVTLKQLLFSRFWGYGASTWGDGDGLSLSVGQVQWIVPLLIFILILIRRQWRKWFKFVVLFILGWGFLLLTHNKSVVVWNLIAPMEYLQFPWRFLGLAVFCFSLAAGVISLSLPSKRVGFLLAGVIVAAAIAFNTGFFFEDLWFNISDRQMFSGIRYEDQISSSANDFWPKVASKTPTHSISKEPVFLEGSGSGQLIARDSQSFSYQYNIRSKQASVQVPMVYFPGWVAYQNKRMVLLSPTGDYGLITAFLPQGNYRVDYFFKNTLVRDIGNGLTFLSMIIWLGGLIFWYRKEL